MRHIYEKFILKTAPYILVVAGLIMVYVTATDLQGTSRQNNGYVRVISCITYIPATIRTREDIDRCYDFVDKDLNIKLHRYNSL